MANDLKFTRFPFEPGEAIPGTFTCEGENVSPPLAWSGAPETTKTFALIVDDPDAPGRTFVHWVCYNIPIDTTQLARGADLSQHVTDAAWGPEEGSNDFGDIGYGGPCPPRGDDPHRYFFRLYALDVTLDLAPGATRQQVMDAMEGHVVASAELMGTFAR